MECKNARCWCIYILKMNKTGKGHIILLLKWHDLLFQMDLVGSLFFDGLTA